MQNPLMGVILAVLPSICGVLIDINWRIVFYLSAGINSVTILLLIPYLCIGVKRQSYANLRFDFGGCVVLFLAVILFNISFTFMGAKHYWLFGTMLIASIAMFVGFVFVEKYVKDPIFPL